MNPLLFFFLTLVFTTVVFALGFVAGRIWQIEGEMQDGECGTESAEDADPEIGRRIRTVGRCDRQRTQTRRESRQ